MPSEVELGRAAFDRRAWRRAYELLSAATATGPDDLERLAIAAHLIGADDDCCLAWERAHLAWLAAGEHERAARCAVWLGVLLLLRGEPARGTGWLARAERLVEHDHRGAVRGFLLVPEILGALEGGAVAEAYELTGELLDIARECDDLDLVAIALLSRGQAELARGHVAAGLKLLDEAMVSVTTGEVGPIPAGIVYCAVIESCMEVFELGRAAEWTQALHSWCTSEPDLVPYRGQCLVHRSQVLQARGDWAAAADEAERAAAHLASPFHPALGVARYQRGELHRLRGEFAAAAQAYQAAAAIGRDPAPGMALLRLAEGDVEAAAHAIGRMLAERAEVHARLPVLAAAVEIHLAAGDVDSARAASAELTARADDLDVPMLHAIAEGLAGSVLLTEGRADAALVSLRRAGARWRELGVPYEAARVGVEVARACRSLGDAEAAERELATARATFQRLGAAPDVARLAVPATAAPRDELSARELEVLRLVATGRSNREIAELLVISAHTVARHVQNIFVKVRVSSRAAATAYAYEHGLVVRTDHSPSGGQW